MRQQAITWTSVDQDPQRHFASIGPNELSLGLSFAVIDLALLELGYIFDDTCIIDWYRKIFKAGFRDLLLQEK